MKTTRSIGREWKRREARSGPALIRRGLDFEGMFGAYFSHGVLRAQAPRKSGGDGWVAPPVPIPNTAVKHPHAESTWPATAREAR